MAKTLFLKATSSCTQHQQHYISNIILNSPPNPVSKTMALCSSFSPRMPSQFGHRDRPISYLSAKPQFFVSSKAFSAQANTSITRDDIPACIGFLGLGIMGSPMAQNLIKAGCNVTVWNRTKSKCDPIVSMGAKYKASPEEVAASCDVTFAMLADPESALDVAYGKHGAASGMGPGKGLTEPERLDSEAVVSSGNPSSRP